MVHFNAVKPQACMREMVKLHSQSSPNGASEIPLTLSVSLRLTLPSI